MITKLIPELVAGKKVVEVCTLGDQLIEAGVSVIYNNPKRKVDSKGVAFPTCISINNCVGHFSPLKDDTTVLKDGDIVKMYVGIQILDFLDRQSIHHLQIASKSIQLTILLHFHRCFFIEIELHSMENRNLDFGLLIF